MYTHNIRMKTCQEGNTPPNSGTVLSIRLKLEVLICGDGKDDPLCTEGAMVVHKCEVDGLSWWFRAMRLCKPVCGSKAVLSGREEKLLPVKQDWISPVLNSAILD